jgi:hypothetical protein
VGLFGYLGSEAKLRGLGMVDVRIIGSGYCIGGIVGDNRGAPVTQCYTTGVVSGDHYVGGLVGYNYGDMAHCYSNSTISGNSWVGGLVGSNYAFITDCYSTGGVTGVSIVGGLLGYNDGTLTQCYSTSAVDGNYSVGGLVGFDRGDVTKCYSIGEIIGLGQDSHCIGGLVGQKESTVTHCYSTSGVSGDQYVGGLVGRNHAGSIAGSYSIGSVSGDDSVGGLVGYNYGDSTVIQCYSAGAVNGTSFAGGLVGYSSPTKIMHSIWDMEMSGLSESAGGVGLTTTEMMDVYMLGLNGFANDPNWVLDAGRDYARLAWEGTSGQIIPEPSIEWLNGLGTAEEPYMIDVADQLIVLGRARASVLWDKHFILGADIDLDPNLLGGQIFSQAVIPTFTGVYDGNGHSISHLTIKGDGNLGLFGLLGPGAEVKNLGAVDVNITGSGGGLVGENEGTVTQCYSTGMVTGNEDDIGGLVGYNNGTLTQSYSTCMVSGLGNLGGLVGRNCGSVSQSYSTGVVSGDGRVGGLVGFNIYAGITCCYSTGAVRGNRDVGGLVGYSYYGGVTSCYWDIETSGQVTSAGWGRTTAEMQTATTFLTIRTDKRGRVHPGWDFVDETANGTEDIWWILEGRDYPRLWWETR